MNNNILPRTTELINSLSKQEIYDKVLNHLRKQQIASRLDVCLYRATIEKDGEVITLKCAAGVLIDDDEYSPKMEGLGWSMFVRQHIGEEIHDVEKIRLICGLQDAHDSFMPMNEGEMTMNKWEKEMEDLAKHYELLYTPPMNESVESGVTGGNVGLSGS